MEVVAENRIGRRILKHVRALAHPRFTGTLGELKAQRYIRQAFELEGYLVTEQPFLSSFFPLDVLPRLVVAIACASLIIGSAVAVTFSGLAIELSALAFLLNLLGTRWSHLIERLYGFRHFGKLRSKNIIAIHPHQEQHLNVVFTAHYDSISQTWSGSFRATLYGTITILAGLTSVSMILVTCGVIAHPWVLLPLVPVTILTILVQVNQTHNASPGAYDNASGVAILLELARSFSGERPNANLAFIATGAEEAGMCGAVALVNHDSFAEQFPPARTIIINLDGIGSRGPIRITDRYGVPPVKTGVLVSRLLLEVVHRFGLDVKSSWHPMGAGMDHIPFAAHGYQSVTLSTAGWDRTFRAMHTKHDTVENLDLTALEYSFAICQELVDSIPFVDRQPA